MTTAPKNMTDVIIRDVTLYSGGQWLTGHDVVVSNGVVESIEKSTGTATPGSVDGSGAYLIPGFVNTHTHLQQSLMRGIAEGAPLLEWLLAVAEESVQITPSAHTRPLSQPRWRHCAAVRPPWSNTCGRTRPARFTMP